MWSTRYYCQLLKKLQFPRQLFEIYSDIKSHENLCSGSRVAACGQTDTTKLTVAFRNIPGLAYKLGILLQRNGLERIKERKCCRYDDVACSVTACYAAFTFVQWCEPLMPNMLHNSRGFHTEPLAGHIHRHPVAYVRRIIKKKCDRKWSLRV